MTTVGRAFLRYLPRRKALTCLQVLGIAVGVAAAVGMALSARAALASFERAVDFLRGLATHSLARPAGPLDETLLRALAADAAVEAFSPVVDRRLLLPGGDGVRLMGVDPFLDRRFRPDLAPAEGGTLDFLFEPRGALVSADLATRLGVAAGSTLATSHGELTLLGTFPNPSGEPLVVMDLGHAQELLGLRGRVDRVDLVLTDAEGFAARWAPGFSVRSVGQSRAALGDLLRAFRLNLEALSLVGLFVGVFLVYNTAMFAVVSRRRDAGILFALGAERREVAAAFLAELLLLGGVGGVLGGALGWALSRTLTGLLGGAISNLYAFLRPTPPEWSWGVAGAGLLLGWASCLLGGLHPLRELVRTDPVAALRGRAPARDAAGRARTAAWWGLGVGLVSVALFPIAAVHVYAGFAGTFGLLVAASLATGVALNRLGPGLELGFARVAGLPGKVAAGAIRRNLGRTAVAVAAFTVALALSVGMGLMIGSFRETLVGWMEGQLRGEIYVAVEAEVEVPPGAYEELAQIPGVEGIDRYRNVSLLYRGTPISLTAVDAKVLRQFSGFRWVQGSAGAWAEVEGGAAIVSESFWRRFGVGRGGTVVLDGVAGPAELPVAGVFYDYTSEHGVVMLDRQTYLAAYGDPTVDSLGVFLTPGSPHGDRVVAEVIRLAAARGLPAATREELHGGILEVFDATFAITRSMRVLAIVVAFFGIAGALVTLHLERQREHGIYRALGFSTPQVAAMTMLEGVGMGLVSFVLSLAVGTALALVLIGVINLRSFHWTIFFHPAWGPYLTAGATALLASAGAAAYPAWRVWRTFPQVQIREE